MMSALVFFVLSFDARMALLDARLASERHEIWISERSAWQRIINMNEARFVEGVLPERDLIQARVQGGLLDLEVSESKHELDAAKRRLATLLGVSESALPDLEEGAEPSFPPFPPDAAHEGMRDDSEEYEAARDEIQTFRLRLLAPCEESAAIEELLYEQLKTTLLSLIDSRATCRNVRLRYREALHRAETSRLRLRQMTGREDFLS